MNFNEKESHILNNISKQRINPPINNGVDQFNSTYSHQWNIKEDE